MREKLGDGTSLVFRMPILSFGLAACGFMELLCQSAAGMLGGHERTSRLVRPNFGNRREEGAYYGNTDTMEYLEPTELNCF